MSTRASSKLTLDRGQSNIMGVILGVTIAAVIGVTVGIGVVGDVVSSNTGTQSVVNETVTGSAADDTVYDLDGFDLQSGETVRAENGTEGSYQEVPSSQYSIDAGEGSINLTDVGGSNVVQSGDEVLITYDYTATDSTATTILELLTLFIALIILVAIASPLMGRV